MKIIKKVYNWFKKILLKIMPPPITTIANIETYLRGLNNGNWIRVPNFFSVTTPTINGSNINFAAPVQGIILVTYYNSITAEIKMFVAKYTDVAERNDWF